jgi:hypothetical protein
VRRCALRQNWRADVRFGSLADIEALLSHVRFTPESGHGRADRPTKGAAEHRGRTAMLAKFFERFLGLG